MNNTMEKAQEPQAGLHKQPHNNSTCIVFLSLYAFHLAYTTLHICDSKNIIMYIIQVLYWIHTTEIEFLNM